MMNVRYRVLTDLLDDALLCGLFSVFADIDHLPAALGFETPDRFLHGVWLGLSCILGLSLVVRGLMEVVKDD
jgi:hypothetical protein